MAHNTSDCIIERLWQGGMDSANPTVMSNKDYYDMMDFFDTFVFVSTDHQPKSALFPNKQCVHAPFNDINVLDDEEWDNAVKASQAVVRAHRENKRTLVTCTAGLNRSGLVVALALIVLRPDMTREEIIKLIRDNRRMDMRLCLPALFNEGFVKAIKTVKKETLEVE